MIQSRSLPKPLLCIAITFLLIFVAFPASAQTRIVQTDVKHDVSPPLRDLVGNVQIGPTEKPIEAEPARQIPLPQGFKPSQQPDTALQQTAAIPPQAFAPQVGLNFDGIGQGVAGFSVFFAPPDTNGAVGLTQYVQWVNVNFAVFDKTNGNLLLGPVAGNTLWTGFGGPCETNNDGDPVVVYDKLNDRWVFGQFAVRSGGGFLTNTFQCIAVSTTSDATGTFNRYAFQYNNEFDDYPKMGVWPDAYYATFNMFSAPIPNSFLGADACAYDGNAMRHGQLATQVCFQQASSVGSLLPSDVDGHRLPPAGSPNFMMDFGANSLNLYKFHVDFVNTANSTFTGPTNIPVTAFTPFLCPGFSCVPQPNTTNLVDTLGDRLMYRLAYRNFGDHESLVVNHSVTTNSSSGVRWYEIQNPNGTPVVAQQSTYAPDSNFRWMGSIAMDQSGNLAVGFSESSGTVFPSIAIAGQEVSDPRSTLQAETSIVTGAGSQVNGLTRWGDYSAMQVDPADDCTFWYTTEYLKATGSFNWNTRIASFKFPACNAVALSITKTHTGNFTQGDTGKTYSITVKNIGDKVTDGTTVTMTDTLPTGLTATALSGTGWTCTLGTLSCTRTDALAPGGSYPAITLTVNVASNAPGVVTNSVAVTGGGNQDTTHNTASDPTTIIQLGPDPTITKTHTGSFVLGQTGTYSITVKNVGLSATNGTTVTVTDTLPTGLTANAATGTGWTCVLGPPVSCTRSDALASNASYPAISLTVNVANNAPSTVTNSVSVSGGGDTNNLNNTATDPTSVIPPPPDLIITKTHTGNFNQGQNGASYTLTVKNISIGPTTGAVVNVTDTLPAGLTLSFMSGNGWSCIGLTCTRNDVLAGNASYPAIGLFVNVANNAPASVTNNVTVSGGGEVNTSNDAASDVTTINPSPDVTIALSHTPDPFIVGQTGTLTITVSNVGNAATSGAVSVNSFLPTGLNYVSAVGTGWTCSTLSLNCQRSDALAAGSSYPPISVTVSVVAGGPGGVTTFANVSGGGEFNTVNDSASDHANVTAPVLGITKTHTGTFTVGQPGSYTITVNNSGTVATFGTVTVTDFLPQGLTATATSGTGWICSTLPTTFLTCTRSDSLASNGSYPPLVVTVSVGNTFPSVTNSASVSGGGDLQFHSASDLTSINVPTLAITKSHVGNFIAGQTGNYTIVVSNVGITATAGTVTMNDFLPFGMQAIAAGGTGWGCPNLPTNFVTCTRSDSLPVNGSYPPLTVIVNVPTGATSVTNTASVTGGGDGSTHNANDATTILSVNLSITKSHSGNFNVGQPGTYTIAVSNAGNLATKGTVTVTDPLPSGLTATAVNAPGWTCSTLPSTFLTCTRSDSLGTGQSYPLILLTVSVNTSGFVFNTASVTGGGDTASHSFTDFTTINGGGSTGPNLTITKSHIGTFVLGQSGTYTIKVGNAGPAPTSGLVNVNDFLPSSVSATAINGPGWNCSPLPTSFIGCSRSDSLAAGASYPTITLTVSVLTGGTISNTASVNGGGDNNGSHFSTDTTTVNGPTLSIQEVHAPDPFTVGQPGTYTFTVTNTGSTGTVGTVTVSDQISPNFTIAAATGTGWSCSGTNSLTCTRTDKLAANSSYPPITLTVNVNSSGTAFNFVNLTGGGDPNFHSASDTVNVVGPVLAITKSHTGNFTFGQTGTYTITVSNTGPGATVGTVTMTDFLPSGMSVNSASGTGWNCSGITTVVCVRSDSLAANASYPPISLVVNVGNTGNSVVNTASVTGGGDSLSRSASDPTTIGAPTLAITKTHTGDFTVGQPGNYTISVSNTGSVATAGTVTVTDFMPFTLTATAFSGTGWVCSNLPSTFLTCTRSDALAPTSSYPPLVVTVIASGGGTNIVNTASVTGGGDGVTHSASDPTNLITPTLGLSKTHTGNFIVGQPGTYTITASNVGTIPTFGSVTVNDTLPSGLTVTGINASGWSCFSFSFGSLNCSRSDTLAASSSYPPITLTVALAPTVPAAVINQASISGGGDVVVHSASDTAAVSLPDLSIAMSHNGNFFRGQRGAAYTITVSNVGAIPTAGGTLLVTEELPVGLTATAASGTGWSCAILPGPQTEMDCTSSAGAVAPGSSYPPITLTVNVAANAPGSVNGTVSVFGINDANFANNFASNPTTIGPPHNLPADFDGDGRSDFAVWRPSSGGWFVLRTSDGGETIQGFGSNGDIPVSADYDGDGKADFAVWRPSTGGWFVLRSGDGGETIQAFGSQGDIPVQGDYDGDGKADFAVWRPSTGGWFILRSSDGGETIQQFGSPGDIPVPGDYDGDGKTDFAVWRPSTGVFFVLRSSDGGETIQQFGSQGDIPVPGDYDGDGKTDFAVWRPSTGGWFVLRSSDGGETIQAFGSNGDIPVPGDYDGDGKTDFAVWRPSTGGWFVLRSSDGGETIQGFGSNGDIPASKPVGQ